MKQKSSLLVLLILGALVVNPGAAHPQTEKEGDRTLSPYFFVKSDDPEVDQLPLKATSVKVDISGVIADVVVTQVYQNEGKKPLEAIYIFPASTRAAVYGMKMTIMAPSRKQLLWVMRKSWIPMPPFAICGQGTGWVCFRITTG